MKEIKTDSRNFQNALSKAVEKKPAVHIGKQDEHYYEDASNDENS